jgi:hypothetical protein
VTHTVLDGLNGSSPLGFLGALGLLRVARVEHAEARVGFLDDGTFRAFIEGVSGDLALLVETDAGRAAGRQPWRLEYPKVEKKGSKVVADLKPPPEEFKKFLDACVALWLSGTIEPVAYAAAFGTTVARDGKGNTKPTAFHFTAANQQFLGTVEEIRASVTSTWAERSLFQGHAGEPGSNLRWDPAAERNYALMANNPNDDGTSVNAPVEWLAFRALPLFPAFPEGARVTTTCVEGRGDDMRMTWPLWSSAISIEAVRTVLHMRWPSSMRERAGRGVFAVCSSKVRRTAQGFGNFAPATVES